MLLQLENPQQDDVNKLIDFAKQNQLKLSLIDDNNDYFLPGKPLTENEVTQLINDSRKSGIISMEDAHSLIRKKYDAG